MRVWQWNIRVRKYLARKFVGIGFLARALNIIQLIFAQIRFGASGLPFILCSGMRLATAKRLIPNRGGALARQRLWY
jgi:hypothetical protein